MTVPAGHHQFHVIVGRWLARRRRHLKPTERDFADAQDLLRELRSAGVGVVVLGLPPAQGPGTPGVLTAIDGGKR